MSPAAPRCTLPLIHGVAPSLVVLPAGPWGTLLEFLTQRFAHIAPHTWHQRIENQQIFNDLGHPLPPHAPYQAGARIHYYRHQVAEQPIPFDIHIIFEDEHLLVIDKPHFLPVTPGGHYVQECVLSRLKHQLNMHDLSPLHRLDKDTAGLVLLSKQAHHRDAYQALFRNQLVNKLYWAVAPAMPQQTAWPLTRTSRMARDPQHFFKMCELEGTPNSHTTIHCLGTWQQATPHSSPTMLGAYQLQPQTGQMHQLRVHMNALGVAICNDAFYPHVRHAAHEAADFTSPLQLLAYRIGFIDPISHQHRQWQSQRHLQHWPTHLALQQPVSGVWSEVYSGHSPKGTGLDDSESAPQVLG